MPSYRLSRPPLTTRAGGKAEHGASGGDDPAPGKPRQAVTWGLGCRIALA